MKKVQRPWGYFRILLQGKGYWVKRLSLRGGRTSLQAHQDRDEVWVIYVPAGVKHRLGGQGDVLELALGEPREEDIQRVEDDYGRSEGTRGLQGHVQ